MGKADLGIEVFSQAFSYLFCFLSVSVSPDFNRFCFLSVSVFNTFPITVYLSVQPTLFDAKNMITPPSTPIFVAILSYNHCRYNMRMSNFLLNSLKITICLMILSNLFFWRFLMLESLSVFFSVCLFKAKNRSIGWPLTVNRPPLVTRTRTKN